MGFVTASRFRFCLLLMLFGAAARPAAAQPELLGAQYQADVAFPEFARFWFEDLAVKAGQTDAALRKWYADRPMGGCIHVYLRKAAPQLLTIEDVELSGISLKRAIAFSDQRKERKPASIYFSALKPEELAALEAAGEPVWWKADPPEVVAGAVSEIVVRLRRTPKSDRIALKIACSSGALPVEVPVSVRPPWIESISFSPDRKTAYLFFANPNQAGAVPKRILLDGRELSGCQVASDPVVDIVPVVARLPQPLERGVQHCFQGVYADGQVASGAARAWSDEFVYGMWGGRPGKAGDDAAARAYVRELSEHNINVQMPQVGSEMLAELYSSAAGQQYCDSLGLRRMLTDPGKWQTKDPYAYFIHDEPDCGDDKIQGLQGHAKVGSLAQWAVGRTYQLRRGDALTPQLLNVDLTFKPDNWYTYGQVPDIFCADPYYQVRLFEAYGRHPERRALYEKATLIEGVATVARSAAAPHPLHVVLYACRRGEEGRNANAIAAEQEEPAKPRRAKRSKEDSSLQPPDPRPQSPENTFRRFPTPAEKRIETFYAIAGGAKGLSFWWFTPGGGISQGLGTDDPQARALWREIGLLGAELRTAGPLILTACPATLRTQASPGLWVRTLLSGTNSVVLLVVNDQYANTDRGTDLRPIENAEVALTMPSWLAPQSIFEIDARGIHDVKSVSSDRNLDLQLGRVEVSRLVVVAADAGLRADLENLFQKQFAANVARLSQPSPAAGCNR